MANMNLERIESQLLEPMRQGRMVRMIYFGSSNTERNRPGMHWGDWLELGLKKQYGKEAFQAFNVGVSGHSTRDLLGRFERDVAQLHPQAVLITIGGNDSGPRVNLSDDEYRRNLLELHWRVTQLGAQTILQTYYGCDLANIPPEHGQKLTAFMQIKREVAAQTGAPLIDQYERWQPLLMDRKLVELLLADPLHTTECGNALMGVNLLRAFGCPLTPEMRAHAPEALRVDAMLEHESRVPRKATEAVREA